MAAGYGPGRGGLQRVDAFPSEERFGLTNQLRRAATSVPLNIAEGAGAGSDAEFRRFLRMGLRSTYELETPLEIAFRIGDLNDTEAARLLDKASQLSAMLNGLIKTITRRSNLHEEQETYNPSHQSNI